MNNWIPYVYIVKNKTTGLKYIGVKYSKTNTLPELFWKTYFTSSKHVKKLIDLYGIDDFSYRIIKTFDNSYDALKFENSLNRIAFKRDDYLNFHYNFLGEKTTREEYEFQQRKSKKISSFIGRLSYINKTGIFKLTKEERRQISIKCGHKTAEINKALGRGFYDPEDSKKRHETLRRKQVSAYYDPKLRHEICSKGGKKGGFTKSYYEKMGLTEEQRIQEQRNRGKRGGPKNKGFIWYNDGVKLYKYTAKQQLEKPIEDFLAENVNFRLGTLGKSTVGRLWVNDGKNNYMIKEDDFDPSIYAKGRLGDKSRFNGHKNKKNN